MPSDKSRVGRVLTQEDGLKVRETLLRVEPTVDIYVREKWAEGAESKLPVLLLHGGGMDGSGWDLPFEDLSLVDALAHHGSHTFALDFRGYGRSSRLPDGRMATVRSFIADTLAVVEYVREVTGQSRTVLVGESLGAGVATAVAERQPERIAGLALLGFIYRTIALPPEVLATAAAVEYAGYSYVREEEWPNTTMPSASPATIAWHQRQFGSAYLYPIGTFSAAEPLPYAKTPERITAQVLVITGDRDPLASVPDVREFLQAAGSARTQHLYQRGVGHLPYVERQAQDAQRAILELIDNCTAETQS